ncbi:alkylhydroperoxidase family enzyme [Saccharothrix tamanrassetensis]|uniref:Alkylhydroperoxidase family enzyme n=1 Tax=Saccharothrix tamanrassetensis TaxID=1051531 RepID=A0A841CIL0_9PSEU|nr:carboxymuconolactone decarboxylase family protein [Saccharothrix tamanrassetensis]MBB5957271.1 alkylhydroperoxidase family enzyme [Saccharothrix tamanrassetensis]
MSDNAERLPLIDPASAPEEVRSAFAKLPGVNLFRAMASATTLYPPFVDYLAELFQDMELDARTARLAVLLVGKLSDCHYVWRQNVVTAKSVGVTDEQIAATARGDLTARCFSPEQRAVLAFTEDCVINVEVADPIYDAAARELSARAIAELLYVVGTYMLICRFARSGRVPLDEKPGPSPYAS